MKESSFFFFVGLKNKTKQTTTQLESIELSSGAIEGLLAARWRPVVQSDGAVQSADERDKVDRCAFERHLALVVARRALRCVVV